MSMYPLYRVRNENGSVNRLLVPGGVGFLKSNIALRGRCYYCAPAVGSAPA